MLSTLATRAGVILGQNERPGLAAGTCGRDGVGVSQFAGYQARAPDRNRHNNDDGGSDDVRGKSLFHVGLHTDG